MKTKFKILVALVCAWSLSITAAAGTVSFSNPSDVFTITGSEAQGYDAIYVVRSTAGLSVSYTASSASSSVDWRSFTDSGEAYSTPISGITRSGSRTTLTNLSSFVKTPSGTAFTVTEGTLTTSFLVIDYSMSPLNLNGFRVENSDGFCSMVILHCDSAEPLNFYTRTAALKSLSRDLKLQYSMLRIQEIPASEDAPATESLYTEDVSFPLPAIPASGTLVDSPSQVTTFTISGDRFTKWFTGSEQTVSYYYSNPQNPLAATSAVLLTEKSDNQMTSSVVEARHYGSSGPLELELTAEVNDAATFVQWQVSMSSDFSEILYNYPYTSMHETFSATGISYIRFYAANAEGTCTFYSPTYTVEIGESRLDCPNAFSPNDDGVNDVWKVSYRSIESFECNIFNRWGQQVCSFTNPADGWDGTFNGKPAPNGVYYYVIKARGTDGREYKKGGDINIIRRK